MFWLTGRQQRWELAIAGAVSALALVFLVKTGSDLTSAYRQIGLSACLAHRTSPHAFQRLAGAFPALFSAAPYAMP